MKYLLVFVGGGLGSALRYFISRYFNHQISEIPYGTLLVNVLGSLIIGIVLGMTLKSNVVSENQTLLLATGFCGGFTTFSAFAYENVAFIKNGDYLHFMMYSLGSLIIAILAVFLGLLLTK